MPRAKKNTHGVGSSNNNSTESGADSVCVPSPTPSPTPSDTTSASTSAAETPSLPKLISALATSHQKPKKKIVKKKKTSLIEKSYSDEQKQFLKNCMALERIEKQAEKLHSVGHKCIRVYYEMNPPTLVWCKKKKCIMESAAAAVMESVTAEE